MLSTLQLPSGVEHFRAKTSPFAPPFAERAIEEGKRVIEDGSEIPQADKSCEKEGYNKREEFSIRYSANLQSERSEE